MTLKVMRKGVTKKYDTVTHLKVFVFTLFNSSGIITLPNHYIPMEFLDVHFIFLSKYHQNMYTFLK